MPHPLRHGSTVYNGHLRGPVTLTLVAFGSGAVTTCFYDLGLSRPGIKPRSPHTRRTLYLYATAVVIISGCFFSTTTECADSVSRTYMY